MKHEKDDSIFKKDNYERNEGIMYIMIACMIVMTVQNTTYLEFENRKKQPQNEQNDEKYVHDNVLDQLTLSMAALEIYQKQKRQIKEGGDI